MTQGPLLQVGGPFIRKRQVSTDGLLEREIDTFTTPSFVRPYVNHSFPILQTLHSSWIDSSQWTWLQLKTAQG